MKRLIRTYLGAAVLLGVLAARGPAQAIDYAPSALSPEPASPGLCTGFAIFHGPMPVVRRELGPALLTVVHPLMALLPPEGIAVSCPYLIARCGPPQPLADDPPDVWTNLQRLLQADQLLKHGEELSRGGRFYEAVECFQQVHRLVPGTNLEARAGAATQDVLVRVYGTATESGLVDEQCEPAKDAPPPSGACSQCGAELCAARADAPPAEAAAKPKTVVYPVADLLGRGKETRLDDLEELMEVIASTVEPKSWSENGGEGTMDCYYRSRAVVVRQTPEVQEQVAELLAGLRQAKADSDAGEERPHRPAPSLQHAAKADVERGCCEECAAEHGCPKKAVPAACPAGQCEECEATGVLTLPSTPAPEDARPAPRLEIVIEGGKEGSVPTPVQCLRCTGGGTCAEAAAGADGLRLRWRVPVGPLTLLVRYEHRELSLGVGFLAESGSAAEESESHH